MKREILNDHFELLLLTLVLIVIANGCSKVKVPVPVTHPAEINMKNYEHIAIKKIRGNMGNRFREELKTKLMESERFKVVDRSQMKQIMAELELSQSDLSDSSNTVKLGKIMTASAFITGRAEGRYSEKMTREKGICYKNDKKYTCTYYYRKGTYSISGGIDVVDVQTGQILGSKVLNAEFHATTSATNKRPERVDKKALADKALKRDIEEFVKTITPWTETCYLPFRKNRKIPELEQGINLAMLGEMDQAIKIFLNACESSEMNPGLTAKHIALAYWNLGLAYEYSDEFDKAVDAFKKGFSIHPDDRFIQEISHTKTLKAEKIRLDEQS